MLHLPIAASGSTQTIHPLIQLAHFHPCSVRCWAVAAGVVMFTSELLLAGSLLTFRGSSMIAAAKHMAEAPTIGGLAGLRARLLNVIVISMLYVPVRAQQLQARGVAVVQFCLWPVCLLGWLLHSPRVVCPAQKQSPLTSQPASQLTWCLPCRCLSPTACRCTSSVRWQQ
jgi:hypothetical protein